MIALTEMTSAVCSPEMVHAYAVGLAEMRSLEDGVAEMIV